MAAVTGTSVTKECRPTTTQALTPAAGIPVLAAGSGEQRLLRIAAKHADMINLSLPSGDSLARYRNSLDVLRQHCETLPVGRDPAQITGHLQGHDGRGRIPARKPGPRGTSGPRRSACASLPPRRGRSSVSRRNRRHGRLPRRRRLHHLVELACGAGPETIALAAEGARSANAGHWVSSFLNIRVKDIHAVYAAWSARGAHFLTPPKQHQYETRCDIRDPDGHLIEVGQTTDREGDWTPAHWPSSTPAETSG